MSGIVVLFALFGSAGAFADTNPLGATGGYTTVRASDGGRRDLPAATADLAPVPAPAAPGRTGQQVSLRLTDGRTLAGRMLTDCTDDATLLTANGKIHLRTTASSDPANRGTGRDEPQMYVVNYGKGRGFTSVAGHDANAMSAVGVVITFQRGVEWAATGKVTQKAPADFPNARSVSYRPDIAALDPACKNGLSGLTVRPGAAPNGPRRTSSGPGEITWHVVEEAETRQVRKRTRKVL